MSVATTIKAAKPKLSSEELKLIRQNNYKIYMKKKYKDKYLFDDNNDKLPNQSADIERSKPVSKAVDE